MIVNSIVHEISSAQSASGAFISMVWHDGKWFDDENGFITALVIRELGKLSGSIDVSAQIERGLNFLESCRSRALPGAFHFYPPGHEPEWMGTKLPPDADDTSLYILELLKHGRMMRDEARRIIEEVLEPYRLHYRPESMPCWVRQGAYRTWLEVSPISNPIDCCVNTNVAALLKTAAMCDHPGYAAACKTIINGVRWAGYSQQHAKLLTPYYSHPAELFHAMQRALDAGVEEFRETLDFLAINRWANSDAEEDWPSHRPVCSSLDGKTFWVAPILQLLRRNAGSTSKNDCSCASPIQRTATQFAQETINA